MSYVTTIKDGISTVHQNWQLIIVQFVSMVFSLIGFFAIVGIPIAVAFIMFGLDLTEILRLKDLSSIFKGSADLLHKYFAMAIVIILSLLLYVSFIVVLWVFTISGTIGILKNGILEPSLKFSLKAFFKEGRNFFFSLFLFSALINVFFIILAFILGLLVGVVSTIIETVKTYEYTLALFLGVFFSLLMLSAGVFLIVAALSLTTYGIAYLSFNRSNALGTIKGTVKYLYSEPSSVAFCAILLLGYMAIGFLVLLIGSPFTLIPVIGTILSLPYHLITYAIQGYLSLVMLSSILHYYYKTGYSYQFPVSIEGSDTSRMIEDEQSPAPQEKAQNQQE